MLVGAGIALITGALLLSFYLGGLGAAMVVGVAFEKGRYKPDATSGDIEWQVTNERFFDDTSGKWMRVRFNPKTGERDYVEES